MPDIESLGIKGNAVVRMGTDTRSLRELKGYHKQTA